MPTPINTNTIFADEKTWQTTFYGHLYGRDFDNFITVNRSTDGYTKGILFEHKTNVQSYGQSKALGQALIYLARFNRDGIPVPSKICLVGQNEQKCYIYDSEKYIEYINNIERYANLKASDGIPGFSSSPPSKIIEFDMSSINTMQEILDFVKEAPKTIKVKINVHNVYGWSEFYYNHAIEYGQKPEKKKFFEELRNPIGTLQDYIEPWDGHERDFKYIMDILNDPATQKQIGAFYTPPEYARLACGLVRQAIKRALDAGKKDYIIIDTCAGTGNLEMYLDDKKDDILSHVIVSTYELKEWIVLKDRFGGRVRYIIPPIPANNNTFPELNSEGFLSGANALNRDIIDNPVVRKYLDDENCAVIIFINPPYVESSDIIRDGDKTIVAKRKSDWKNGSIVKEMSESLSGVVLNDMANVFIWSSFEHYLRQDTDSLIVFSPVKYWKSQGLVKKKFMGGYAFNRKAFHASTEACIMCAYWSNEDDDLTDEITLSAKNIVDGKLIDEGDIVVKKVYTTFSDKYFDSRTESGDRECNLLCEIDGTLSNKNPVGITPINNENIIGYLVAFKNTFDSPRYCSMLLRFGIYNGHGFYLRSDNFMKKLPLFAASRYTDHCNNWKIMSMIMKSADKANEYEADVGSGKLDIFLFRTLFWVCTSHYPHMRSLVGSDDKLYLNQLCFDGNTLAKKELDNFKKDKGYNLTDEEKLLWNKMQELYKKIKKECCEEYNPKFKYGLYQIDEEINIKKQIGFKPDGEPLMDWKYGDLNNLIKEIKILSKQYYINNLVENLFKYEFLK